MCGICGIINLNGDAVSPQRLRGMADCIAHRGPDDDGFFLQGPVGLGHRRLSIIDLAGGHQPLCNEDETVWIVFNGEIYNFPELRTQLEQKGHHFRTHSDTETIVHAYEEWGEECPTRLRGMFAFAIYDLRNQSLFIARDRIGKKPLLYTQTADSFLFASEFQALLAHPGVTRRVNLASIDLYLASYCIPAPHTAYEGIFKLPPAHSLTLKKGEVKLRRYWDMAPFFEPSRKLQISEEAAAEELLERLREAVKIRMMSEVPLGAFLSGGVDSSVLVALMATLSDRPVKTFSIDFEEGLFSEAEHARRIANKYGCEHTEITVKPDAASVLPMLVRHYGEPFGDSSAVLAYYVSQATRRYATVALNGDGGDEVFAGYERYRALRITESLPAALRRAGGVVERLIPGSLNSRARQVLLKRLLQAAALPAPQRYLRWHSSFNVGQKHEFYTPEFAQAVHYPASHPIAESIATHPQLEPVDRAQLSDLTTYLPDDLLVKLDVASMATSLEARSPFLDHPLMEWAATLPPEMKMKGATGKYILRHAARDLVPIENMARTKMGFSAPVGTWFRGPLKEMLQDTVSSPRALGRGYFRPEAVRALVQQHITGQSDHTLRLWTLLMLELWHGEFID